LHQQRQTSSWDLNRVWIPHKTRAESDLGWVFVKGELGSSVIASVVSGKSGELGFDQSRLYTAISRMLSQVEAFMARQAPLQLVVSNHLEISSLITAFKQQLSSQESGEGLHGSPGSSANADKRSTSSKINLDQQQLSVTSYSTSLKDCKPANRL